jgi:hypothetical protein
VNTIPMSIREANAWVSLIHRHNAPVGSALWAIAAQHDGATIGVAIIGRPVARALCDGWTVEVRRLAVTPEAPKGACSYLYGAARRIAGAFGYRKVITYTLETEGGASLRGAGWQPTKASRPHQWQRSEASKDRAEQAVCGQQKIRWEATV